MPKLIFKPIFSILLSAFLTFNTFAGEKIIDKISCTPSIAYLCTLKHCQKIDTITVYTKQHFEVDPVKKTLSGFIADSRVEIEHINTQKNAPDFLVFSGSNQYAHSTHNWILRIDKSNKKMTATSISENISITIFGSCRW